MRGRPLRAYFEDRAAYVERMARFFARRWMGQRRYSKRAEAYWAGSFVTSPRLLHDAMGHPHVRFHVATDVCLAIDGDRYKGTGMTYGHYLGSASRPTSPTRRRIR